MKNGTKVLIAASVLAAGVALGYFSRGSGRDTKPLNQKPKPALIEPLAKEKSEKDKATTQRVKEIVTKKVNELKDVLKAFDANEKDLSRFKDEDINRLTEKVKSVVEALLETQEIPLDTIAYITANSIVRDVLRTIYDSGSNDTKQAIIEFASANVESENVNGDTILYYAASAQPPATFDEFLKLSKAISRSEYSEKVIPTLVIGDKYVATLLPPGLIEGKINKKAEAIQKTMDTIVSILKENGVPEEELNKLKEAKNGIDRMLKKDGKELMDQMNGSLYERATSPKTRALLGEVYCVLLKKFGVISDEEKDAFSKITDGNPPKDFNGVKRNIQKAKKSVKARESGFVLKPRKPKPEAVSDDNPYND